MLANMAASLKVNQGAARVRLFGQAGGGVGITYVTKLDQAQLTQFGDRVVRGFGLQEELAQGQGLTPKQGSHCAQSFVTGRKLRKQGHDDDATAGSHKATRLCTRCRAE